MSNEKQPKKKGFFVSLGLVKDTENENTAETNEGTVKNAQTSTEAPAVNTVKNTTTILTAPVIPSGGAFNQDMYQHIMKSLEESNKPGIDYWEFLVTKKQMDAQPGMTEQMKYASAFIGMKSASGNQLTKESLLKDADFYIGVVDKEVQEFSQEISSSRAEKVDALIAEAKEKDAKVEEKIQLINKLNEEIAQLRNESSGLQNEAQNNSVKFENALKNFTTTAEVIKKQINDDKANITQYIQ